MPSKSQTFRRAVEEWPEPSNKFSPPFFNSPDPTKSPLLHVDLRYLTGGSNLDMISDSSSSPPLNRFLDGQQRIVSSKNSNYTLGLKGPEKLAVQDKGDFWIILLVFSLIIVMVVPLFRLPLHKNGTKLKHGQNGTFLAVNTAAGGSTTSPYNNNSHKLSYASKTKYVYMKEINRYLNRNPNSNNFSEYFEKNSNYSHESSRSDPANQEKEPLTRASTANKAKMREMAVVSSSSSNLVGNSNENLIDLNSSLNKDSSKTDTTHLRKSVASDGNLIDFG